jgi:NAD(P)-dependent dehydrogenase (short-subunit alcohol dehydrogenase family)
MPIEGKTILVTGGAVRLGRAVALELAERGGRVLVHYRRSKAKAEEVCRAIRHRRGRAFCFQADLGGPREIERLFDQVKRAVGGIDGLVNNAAIYRRTPWIESTLSDWQEHIDVNLRAPWLCSRWAVRLMPGGRGKIVNLADSFGSRPYRGYLPYAVSKGGVGTLTHALARELAPKVQVNAVAPGAILWPGGKRSPSQGVRRRILEGTLLKRKGRPEDIASAVCFLIESDYITGEVVHVDGGRHIF